MEEIKPVDRVHCNTNNIGRGGSGRGSSIHGWLAELVTVFKLIGQLIGRSAQDRFDSSPQRRTCNPHQRSSKKAVPSHSMRISAPLNRSQPSKYPTSQPFDTNRNSILHLYLCNSLRQGNRQRPNPLPRAQRRARFQPLGL